MQLDDLRTNTDGRELTPHGTPLFPVSLYDNRMASFAAQRVPWHWHDECEIVLVASGGLILECSTRAATLEAGSAAFVRSGALHAMHSECPEVCRMHNVLFSAALIAGEPSTIFGTRYVLPVLEDPALDFVVFNKISDTREITAVRMLTDCLAACGPHMELRARNHLSDIWIGLLERCGASSTGISAPDRYIRTLIQFVQANYARPITLADIAASAGISRRTCNRSFSTQLGMSPFSYLLECRVEHAAELLAKTDDSVLEIGLQCGFSDQSYFQRMFRKKMGITPLAYRRMVQGARAGQS